MLYFLFFNATSNPDIFPNDQSSRKSYETEKIGEKTNHDMHHYQDRVVIMPAPAAYLPSNTQVRGGTLEHDRFGCIILDETRFS